MNRPTQAEGELTALQRRFGAAWELVVHCYQELGRVRASGMAAELTYRTIFSLVPVVVLGLVMFRIVGGLEEVQRTVENQLYSFFGVPDVPGDYGSILERDAVNDDLVSEPLPPGALPSVDATEKQATKLKAQASIRQSLHEVTAKVANLDFASIGIVGLVLFIYAAIALADSVEQLFNLIYDAPADRPPHIRLAIHWSIITLGSGLLALSLYLSGQFVEFLVGVVPGHSFSGWFNRMLSALASWVMLFLLYALMPNTQVSARAAIVGSAVAAVLWEGAKFGFQIYVAKAVPYSALYGSLGLIPLFLFWIYITWVIVLFGLILTQSLQRLHGRDPRHLRESVPTALVGDPDWMLPIMLVVARAFETGSFADEMEIAERLRLPGGVVHSLLGKLEEAGFVCRLASTPGREEGVTLARPSSSIGVCDILTLGHQMVEQRNEDPWLMLSRLNQAQRMAANQSTLADCLSQIPDVQNLVVQNPEAENVES